MLVLNVCHQLLMLILCDFLAIFIADSLFLQLRFFFGCLRCFVCVMYFKSLIYSSNFLDVAENTVYLISMYTVPVVNVIIFLCVGMSSGDWGLKIIARPTVVTSLHFRTTGTVVIISVPKSMKKHRVFILLNMMYHRVLFSDQYYFYCT